MFLGREALKDHSQLPKKANKCSVGAVISYGGIDMFASSLHRESTDSLIHVYEYVYKHYYVYEIYYKLM